MQKKAFSDLAFRFEKFHKKCRPDKQSAISDSAEKNGGFAKGSIFGFSFQAKKSTHAARTSILRCQVLEIARRSQGSSRDLDEIVSSRRTHVQVLQVCEMLDRVGWPEAVAELGPARIQLPRSTVTDVVLATTCLKRESQCPDARRAA